MSTEIDAEIVATCETAATYLGEHGLARNTFVTVDGRACITGALVLGWSQKTAQSINHHILMRALEQCHAIPAVAEVIRERHPARLVPVGGMAPLTTDRNVIFGFNDHWQTTKDEVIEVLQETIKRHTPDTYTSEGAA